MTQLDEIIATGVPILASKMPIFSDKELAVRISSHFSPHVSQFPSQVLIFPSIFSQFWAQAAPIESRLRAKEATAQENLRAEMALMKTPALRQRAIELGVATVDLDSAANDRDGSSFPVFPRVFPVCFLCIFVCFRLIFARFWPALVGLIMGSTPVRLRVLQLQSEYKQLVLDRVVQGQSFPPSWFLPARTRNHLSEHYDSTLLSDQPRLKGNPTWGGPMQQPLWDEGWLLTSLWTRLDEGVVYGPIYLILIALAVISPVLIYTRGSRPNTPMVAT